jgi:hypothetical protein
MHQAVTLERSKVMPPTIRVDDQVYEALQNQAVPFVDSPNDVLRRLLDLDRSRNGGMGGRVDKLSRRDRVRLVADKLAEQGYLTHLENSDGADIVATTSDRSARMRISVKSNRGSARSWVLHQKAENRFGDDLFYVFVSLTGDSGRPAFFVVPSKVVADYVRVSHAQWLATPGKHGQPHIDSSMRMFKDPEGKYLECWELLGS